MPSLPLWRVAHVERFSDFDEILLDQEVRRHLDAHALFHLVTDVLELVRSAAVDIFAAIFSLQYIADLFLLNREKNCIILKYSRKAIKFSSLFEILALGSKCAVRPIELSQSPGPGQRPLSFQVKKKSLCIKKIENCCIFYVSYHNLLKLLYESEASNQQIAEHLDSLLIVR